MLNKLCLTFDVDWAKDEILEPLVEILQRRKIKATFFATHHSQLLSSLDPSLFEIGIHPNFDNSLHELEKPLAELLHIYPASKGIRSHSLFESGRLLLLFQKLGLKYVSNIHLPYHENLHPVIRFGSIDNRPLIGIPFCFSDDFHYVFNKSFDLKSIRLEKNGLNVLAFHPIHVFMNTDSEAFYNSFKEFYQKPQILSGMKNKNKGVETLFLEVLEYISSKKITTYTLAEVADSYINAV